MSRIAGSAALAATLAAACGSEQAAAARDAGPIPDGSGDGADAGSDCPPRSLRPLRRSEHAGVAIEPEGLLAIFGGTTAVPEGCGSFAEPRFGQELWIFEDRCAVWREVESFGPSSRGRHMAAWDPEGRRMFVFGGRYRDNPDAPYLLHDDLWAFDFASETWTELHPGGKGAPPARCAAALGYHPAARALWLFGGDHATTGKEYAPLGDTWRFDADEGAWSELEGEGPGPRVLAGYASDAARGRLWVFGGAVSSVEYANDLWSLDTAAGAWERAGTGAGPAPSPRFSPAIGVGQVGGEVWLMGGQDGSLLGHRNDLWAYFPGGAWRELRRGDTLARADVGACDLPADFAAIDPASPERRGYHVLGAGAGRLWIHGGKTDCGAADDVWRYDLAASAWTEADAATFGELCLRSNDGAAEACSSLCR